MARPGFRDDALQRFVLGLSGISLTSTPGSTYSYCNAGFELLGHLLARVSGQTFEAAVKQLVLDPVNMHQSTFLRADVPPDRAAAPHVGVPLTKPQGVYPYSRSHAPSSTLHSSTDDLCRWMLANLAATGAATRSAVSPGHLHAEMLDVMWQPAVPAGHPPWEEAAGMGWFLGTYRGRRTVSHSGADPRFGSKLILVPEERTGVVVLANSNTAPIDAVARAALDLALGVRPDHGSPSTSHSESGPTTGSPAAGKDPAHLSALLPPQAWTMTGWAHKVDGRPEPARKYHRRALNLDADNHDAAVVLRSIPSTT